MPRTRALIFIAAAELFVMGLWFGVSAVAPQIAKEWRLDEAMTSWLTLAVQLGFVAGTLASEAEGATLPPLSRREGARNLSSLAPRERGEGGAQRRMTGPNRNLDNSAQDCLSYNCSVRLQSGGAKRLWSADSG